MNKKNITLSIVALMVIASFFGYRYYSKQKSLKTNAQNESTGRPQSGDAAIDVQLKVFAPSVLLKDESQEQILYTGENAKIVEASLSNEELKFNISLVDFKELENSKFDIAILTPFDFMDFIVKSPKAVALAEMTQCHYQVKVLVPQDSAISDLQGLSGKVLGMVVSSYPNLYLTLKPFEVSSIYPSKILKYTTNPLGIKALQSKQIDAYTITQRVDPKTPSYDIKSKDKGLKEIYVSDYKIPCRIVVANENINAQISERLIYKLFGETETADFQRALGMHDAAPSDQKSFEKLKQELNWKRDPKIQGIIEDAPLVQNP